MKPIVYHTFLLATSFALIGVLNSCGKAEGKTSDEAVAATAAGPELFPLQKAKLSTGLQLPGELLAYQQVDLYAKVSSFVKELKVDIGSEVKQGDLLITLEAPELSSQQIAADSRLHSQEAIYAASKATYERLLETSKIPGTVSQNDLDQAQARMNADKAQLEAAKAVYKEIGVMKGYLEIRAPFSGVITARNVNPGAYVGPAGRGSEFPLFTLQEQKHLRLAVSVPELYAGYLSNGAEVSFRVKSLPNETFKANVKRMAGALDTKLRSERVEVDVQNESKLLLPGMIAEVSIPLPAKDSNYVVPKSAVVNSAERVFVIRIVNHKAEWVDVKKGRELDGQLEVFGNLNAGDQLVKIGSEEIRNGSALK